MKSFSLLNLILLISLFIDSSSKKGKKKKEPDPETPEFAVGYITLPFTLSEDHKLISQIQIGHPYQDIQLIIATQEAFKNTSANKYNDGINKVVENSHKEIEKTWKKSRINNLATKNRLPSKPSTSSSNSYEINK